MAQTTPKKPVVDKSTPTLPRQRDPEAERVARESSDRYRRYANEVNRTRDADIEKALRS